MAVFLIRQDRIRQDRVGLGVILAVAFIAVPLFGSPFLMEVVMIPFLVLSLATIGLNLLIGYTGLISLGALLQDLALSVGMGSVQGRPHHVGLQGPPLRG